MTRLFKRMIHDVRGTSAVEMGLICALIVLAMLTALQGFANQTTATWTSVAGATSNAVQGATGG